MCQGFRGIHRNRPTLSLASRCTAFREMLSSRKQRTAVMLCAQIVHRTQRDCRKARSELKTCNVAALQNVQYLQKFVRYQGFCETTILYVYLWEINFHLHLYLYFHKYKFQGYFACNWYWSTGKNSWPWTHLVTETGTINARRMKYIPSCQILWSCQKEFQKQSYVLFEKNRNK